MKRTLLLLSVFVTVCLVAAIAVIQAQQTATDEVAIIPLPVPPNVIGTYIKGASSDGKRLVFDSINDYNGKNVDSNTEIYVYDVDTRSIIQITDTADIKDPADTSKVLTKIDNTTPVISGDGTKVVFISNAALAGANNDDANFEVYLADLPRGATTATISRITDTGKNTDAEAVKNIFNNYNPTINDDGSVIGFTSTRRVFNQIPNGPASFTALKEGPNNADPDGNGEIFLYNAAQRQFSQVTVSRDVDATSNFVVKGFNANPTLSGDGRTLAFISGFNYPGANANKNADFNGEIFFYKIGDPNNTFTQVTDTTGTAIVPVLNLQFGIYTVSPDAPVNVLSSNSRPLNRAGTILTFESAGNFDNGNSDKTRELWIYNVTTKAFTRLTNQSVSAAPTQTELSRLDYNFSPSLNGPGTFVTFGSVLNLTPATTSGVKTDNADGSREAFRYDIANNKFRQLTFSPVSSIVIDQRDAIVRAFANEAGSQVAFSFLSNSLTPTSAVIEDLFQAIIIPVSSRNSTEAKIANAASYDTTQVARGSIVAAFGTQLAASAQSAPSANLPFELNNVTATVGGIAARLIYVSPGQVNFVMPDGIANGDAVDFSIFNNGVVSSGKVKVVDAAPGVFSTTGDGKGAPAAQCGKISPDGMSFLISNPPCSVGNEAGFDTLVIYGTGWSKVTGVQVKIGDQTLTPSYSGVQPDFLGLDQINVSLSKELAGKADQEISVIVSTTVESNKTKISFLPLEEAVTAANAASFESGIVAPGSSAIATGTGLSNTTASTPVGTQIDGVTLTVAGLPATLTSVSPTQINFVVPEAVKPANKVEVVVNNNGKIFRGRVDVPKASAGLFTTTNDGNGRVRAQCGRVNADGSITYTDPPCAVGTEAAPNVLRVFGTGWRQAEKVTIKVGDSELTPTFAGAQAGQPGVDIIDVKLVPALAGKVDVDVIVTTTVGTTNKVSKSGVKISFQ